MYWRRFVTGGWGRYSQRGRYIQGCYIQWALYYVVLFQLKIRWRQTDTIIEFCTNFAHAQTFKYAVNLLNVTWYVRGCWQDGQIYVLFKKNAILVCNPAKGHLIKYARRFWGLCDPPPPLHAKCRHSYYIRLCTLHAFWQPPPPRLRAY